MTLSYGKKIVTIFPLLLLVILPCVHLYSIRDNPAFETPVIDSREYVESASQIVNSSLFDTRTDHLSPLYTWFVAFIFSLFGVGNLLSVKLFQILINFGSGFLLYKSVYTLFSKREAVVSLYIWALYGPIVFFTCEILSVPLILFFYNLTIYMVLRARRENGRFWWGGTGLTLGLSVLARPDILIFLLILVVILLLSPSREGGRGYGKQTLLAFFISGALLPLLFASFVNSSSSGKFRFLPEDSGLNFFIGNNPDSRKSIGARPGLFWDSLTEIPDNESRQGASERVESTPIYYERVGRYLHDDPQGFLTNILYKTLTLFNGYELPSTLDIYTFGKYSMVLSILTWSAGSFYFPFGILLPLASLGLWVSKVELESLWLRLMFFSFFISLIGFWNSSRYRMVLIPFLILFASVAVVHLHGLFSRRESGVLWKPLLALALIASLCSISYHHFSRNYNFEAELLTFTGKVLAESEENGEEAIKRLEESLELQGRNESECSGHPFFTGGGDECGEILSSYQASLKGHTSLALADTYLAREEYENSSIYYKLAIETGAVSFLAYNNLGTLMMRQKKLKEGLLHIERSIELRPDYPLSHTNRGVLLVRSGRPADAVEEFIEAIRLGADDSEGYYNLAVALVKADFRRDRVVNIMKSLDVSQERAMMVFTYMKGVRERDKGAGGGR